MGSLPRCRPRFYRVFYRIGEILIVDGTDIAEGFAAFQEFWDAEIAPPAITVQIVSGLAHPDFLVEIEAVAAVAS